jgi:uncharacterized protein with FMN-binding domain
MKPIAKRLLIFLIAILVVALAAGLWFKLRYDHMTKVFATTEVRPVDLSSIDDGTYRGSFGEFLVSVELDVTVRSHRITDIEVVDQRGGSGYEALQTLDRIIEAQSPKVDVVTGATKSSQCIMIAAYRALTEIDQESQRD